MNASLLRSTLQAQLLARPNLISLSAEVHRYPPGSRATVLPTIFFDELSVSSEGLALAGSESDRSYTLTGQAYAATTGGASDDEWDDGETNLTTLIEELYGTLEADPTIGGSCGFAELVSYTSAATQDEETGRTYFGAEFNISIRQAE